MFSYSGLNSQGTGAVCSALSLHMELAAYPQRVTKKVPLAFWIPVVGELLSAGFVPPLTLN